ncbi:MAG: M23 family metallopeptidase [Alphaproteobacteria bacterium]
MMRVVSGVLILLVLSQPALARALSLEGEFVQGGLVTGNTVPGASVLLNGKPVRIAPDGLFVFGLGRDAPGKIILQVVLPDGGRESRTLEIRQRKYRIQRIDGLPRKMVTPSAKALQRIRREGKAIRSARAVFTTKTNFSTGFIWPSKGRISGVYGSQRILNGEPRRPHLGIDIAAPKGTPVLASAGGEVTLAESDLYFTGGTVIVEHGHGLSTVYSHLSKIEVRKGQSVSQGQRIGAVGSTGRSTGPHLDWRINWYQERLDPMLLAGPMPK